VIGMLEVVLQVSLGHADAGEVGLRNLHGHTISAPWNAVQGPWTR
jgi:hypothetical protein